MYMLGLGMRGGVIPGKKPAGLARDTQGVEDDSADIE